MPPFLPFVLLVCSFARAVDDNQSRRAVPRPSGPNLLQSAFYLSIAFPFALARQTDD